MDDNKKTVISVEGDVKQVNISMDNSTLNAAQNISSGKYKKSKDILYWIFVSSTYKDLIEYRKAAEEAINDLDQKYEGIEYMGAEDKESTKACLDLIDKCDLFVGIYAWRYGYVPEGSEKSITELEYDYAVKKGIPRFCYFVDENYTWPPPLMEHTAINKIEKFKQKVSGERVFDVFTDKGSLKYNINNDLSKWMNENALMEIEEIINDNNDENIDNNDNLREKYRHAMIEKYNIHSTLGGINENFRMENIYIPITIHTDCNIKFNGMKAENFIMNFLDERNFKSPVSCL